MATSIVLWCGNFKADPFICFVPLLFCFMIKQDINEELHIFVRFTDIVRPSRLKSTLRIILSSKQELLKHVEACGEATGKLIKGSKPYTIYKYTLFSRFH